MEECDCRKDWSSVTRVRPPRPLLLAWGAHGGGSWGRCTACPVTWCLLFLQLLLPPTSHTPPHPCPRLERGSAPACCPWGLCPELTVERRNQSSRLAYRIISNKNVQFRGGEPQLWWRKGLPPPPSPVRRWCLCRILGMGISGLLFKRQATRSILGFKWGICVRV